MKLSEMLLECDRVKVLEYLSTEYKNYSWESYNNFYIGLLNTPENDIFNKYFTLAVEQKRNIYTIYLRKDSTEVSLKVLDWQHILGLNVKTKGLKQDTPKEEILGEIIFKLLS
jgi:hypothetical protein